MCRQGCIVIILGVIFALVTKGHTLECWKCNSDYDSTCRDYFNVTRIELNNRNINNFNFANYGNGQIAPVQNNPHLEHCDERYIHPPYDQKNVCLKVVEKSSHGLLHVRRECRLVSKNFKTGACPSDINDRNSNLEFCATCDRNSCNTAHALEISLVASITPVVLILFLTK